MADVYIIKKEREEERFVADEMIHDEDSDTYRFLKDGDEVGFIRGPIDSMKKESIGPIGPIII